MKSYFFIPADIPEFNRKIKKIEADEIIIDLEDALAKENFKESIDLLQHLETPEKYFVRPNLFGENGELKTIQTLLDLGFKKFIIPKYNTIKDLHKVEDFIKTRQGIEVILLIENAIAFLNITEVLQKSTLPIVGIALGSQDFANNIGMLHTHENLLYPRQFVKINATACNIDAIDIASMNISDEAEFIEELQSGENLGFSSKFFIHPIQLQYHEKFKKTEKKYLTFAKEVIKYYEDNGRPNIFTFQGQVIEKPHIENFYSLIKK